MTLGFKSCPLDLGYTMSKKDGPVALPEGLNEEEEEEESDEYEDIDVSPFPFHTAISTTRGPLLCDLFTHLPSPHPFISLNRRKRKKLGITKETTGTTMTKTRTTEGMRTRYVDFTA